MWPAAIDGRAASGERSSGYVLVPVLPRGAAVWLGPLGACGLRCLAVYLTYITLVQ